MEEESKKTKKSWTPDEDEILVLYRKKKGYGFTEIERLGVLPDRTPSGMRLRWNAKFEEFDRSPLKEGDVKHILKSQRESNHSNKWAKMAKAKNRDGQFYRGVYTTIMRAAGELGYLLDNGKLNIEPEGEAFVKQVKALWEIVKKRNEHPSTLTNRKEPIMNLEAASSTEIMKERKTAYEEKKEKRRKKEAKKVTRAEMEENLKKMRITAEEKRELEDPNSDKEWVKRHRAREKMLIERGVSKELLGKISGYYNSKLDKGNMVARSRTNMIWQPPTSRPTTRNERSISKRL